MAESNIRIASVLVSADATKHNNLDFLLSVGLTGMLYYSKMANALTSIWRGGCKR